MSLDIAKDVVIFEEGADIYPSRFELYLIGKTERDRGTKFGDIYTQKIFPFVRIPSDLFPMQLMRQ